MVEESHGFVAIIGMACRFPGAPNSGALWDLLVEGRESTGPYPRGRSAAMDAFYDRAGSADGPVSLRCGSLPQLDQFDADFFSISPREAVFVDPQQRLLLELAWEAFEDAGKTQEGIRGSDTGVYAGVWSSDYLSLINDTQEASLLGQNGGALYSASGRLAFVFDLRGPEATVNLGCASGMAAVHLACESLRAGQCGMAVAGAANVILDPGVTLAFTRGGVLSPDGRCKFGDASANGFVRSEGAGLFVLKLLSNAIRDGDRIRAIIRGSAVSNNGNSSQSLMTPSHIGQCNVLRRACEAARLSPADLQYVEAHGTGTAVGDPIEISALADVIGKHEDRVDPCVIGSIKSNLGHTESASGIAGMIKVILAMQHRFVPPSLHVSELTGMIDWPNSGLRIETTGCTWPLAAGTARAGVSSFGLTGTNAHVIFEEAPLPAPAGRDRAAWILPLSASSPKALRALAASWKDCLSNDVALSDACFTAATRRSTFHYRLAVVGSDGTELLQGINEWLNENESSRSPHRVSEREQPGPVFVFPGQGSQWIGMGQGLFRDEPGFRRSIEECSDALQRECGWSLLDQLFASVSDAPSRSIAVVQPALFAIQVALAKLWMSWGVVPGMVVGHSMGEVAAAYTAGALSMEDAAAVIGRRSRLLERLSGRGAMAMVELSRGKAKEAIRGLENKVAIAASNGTQATVLSGDPDAIATVLRSLERRQVFCRLLNVTVASHSPQVDALLAELEASLTTVHSRLPTIPMYSTTLGRMLTNEPLNGAYWSQNLRNPVLFHQAIDKLLTQDFAAFIEISPHPSLLPYIDQAAALHNKTTVLTMGSLRRDEPESPAMLKALSKVFSNGSPVDWHAIYPAGNIIDLPHFPWQRNKYWLTERSKKTARSFDTRNDSMLGNAISTVDGDRIWTTRVDLEHFPWIRDHVVGTTILLPACSVVQIALEAIPETAGKSRGIIEDLSLEATVPLYPDQGTQIQVRLDRKALGRYSFKLHFRLTDEADWTRAASGVIGTTVLAREQNIDVMALLIEQPGDREVSSDQHQHEMQWRGYNFGPSFLRLDRYILRGMDAVAEATPPDVIAQSMYQPVHPVLLDAGFQLLAALFFEHQPHSGRLLPVNMKLIESFGQPGTQGPVYIHAHLLDKKSPVGDLAIYSNAGDLLLRVEALTFAVADPAEALACNDLFYRVAWKPLDVPVPQANGNSQSWLVLADESDTGTKLANALGVLGQTVRLVLLSKVTGFQRRFFVHQLRSDSKDRPLRIVYLRSLDLPDNRDVRAAEESCAGIAALTQAVLDSGLNSQLNLITRGAVSVNTVDLGSVLQASTWGVGAVIANEHPELSCRCIDLPPVSNSSEISALVSELMTTSREDRVALREDGRFVSRLVHAESLHLEPRSIELDKGQSFEMHQQLRGALDSFVLRPLHRLDPEDDQVEIQINSAGLNFRDILQSLGSFEDASAKRVALGLEASGVVTRLGKSVKHLAVGDRVMTLFDGLQGKTLFASHAIVMAELVLPIPNHFTMEEAGSFPAAFLTAYISLVNLARLRSGERVLIHSTTGGVGMAAVQIARWIGAEIFATAGSDDKRAYLKNLGIEHVMDSRSSGFASYINIATDGRGVDVILNSLAGDAISESLEALAPFGRFIELGKRDMWRDARFGYSALLRNRALIGFDLSTMTLDRPSTIATALRELLALAVEEHIKPLPVRIFPISEAAAAFQHMARSAHIGKVAIDMRAPGTRILDALQAMRSDATYLVTGGTGALGLNTAQELVRLGAAHLVLTHRSTPSLSVLRNIESIGQEGVNVQVRQVDVGDEQQLIALLTEIELTMPPLCGIFHCAGVLDDAVVANLELEHFHTTMSGKSQGALLLDRLTIDVPLDFFVMYSSVTSVLGTPGQGNYAAANAVLDALAHDRFRRGLPATTINWGPWSEIGLAAASSNRGKRIAEQGLPSLTPHQGVHLLRRLLTGIKHPQIVAAHFEREAWIAPGAPFLSDLPQQHSRAQDQTSQSVLAHIHAMEPVVALVALERLLMEQTAAVSGRSIARIPRNTSFRSIGLDSLMGLELRNRLDSKLSLKLPASTIWNYPTIESLTEHLAQTLGIGHTDSPGIDNQDQLSLSALLSDEIAEAEALLKWD